MDQRMQDMCIERTLDDITGDDSSDCYIPLSYGDTTGDMEARYLYARNHIPSTPPWDTASLFAPKRVDVK